MRESGVQCQRPFPRVVCLVLAVCLGSAALLPAEAQCEAGYVTASPALIDLYFTAYDEVLKRDILPQPDGTTYISTGDIKAEWLRDSSAVARAYLGQAKGDPAVAAMIRGVIERQARYVLVDPYANAFTVNYLEVERKFEADSLLYVVWLAYLYWHQTGDASIFTGDESLAFDRVLSTLRDEQHHMQRSRYSHPALPNGGRGTPVGFTGMVWSGFRPSDDLTQYGYNIPVNAFAVVVLRDLTEIEQKAYRNERQAANAWGLSVQIQRGIEQFGLGDGGAYGRIYAYEVDGFGRLNLMDDANVPSLLSLPYFGYLHATDAIYQGTRGFALSSHNPFFYSGTYAQGIGSPHTPPQYVWPLALVMQALTSISDAETARVLGYIAASDVGDHLLHESFNVNDPRQYTRADFAWPNALYVELISAMHPKAATASSGQAVECFSGLPALR
jgi:meiotically up-regulated gene 157 (Mug157) protein